MTPRMHAALLFIEGYLRNHDGVSPCFREIRAALGLRSNGDVHRLVHALERRGYIGLRAGSARSIRVLRPTLPDTAAGDAWYAHEVAAWAAAHARPARRLVA
jgi:SOS-response transcriptional repressor LexA